MLFFFTAPMSISEDFKDVVELVKANPRGIPLKKLTMFFNQKYRRNLSVSELGFSSIPAFINSLRDDLSVDKERVYHKDHVKALAVTTPVNKEICFGADSGHEGTEMTHPELLHKVKEVIKVFPAASHSITELQNGFFLLFGSALPLKLYMSLYDNHTAKQDLPSGPFTDNTPAGAKCLDGLYLFFCFVFCNAPYHVFTPLN